MKKAWWGIVRIPAVNEDDRPYLKTGWVKSWDTSPAPLIGVEFEDGRNIFVDSRWVLLEEIPKP